MFGKELIMQIETAEDDVHLRHVVVVVTVKWVVRTEISGPSVRL